MFVTQRSASTETFGRPAVVTTSAHASDLAAEPAAPLASPAALQPMSRVVAGSYRPFYRARDAAPALQVAEFWLDVAPVSRASFAAFVTADPRWRRSGVEPLFAERAYLSDWVSDLDPGPDADTRPVEQVSWFAAKAYCAWQGKRLPSVAEWERANGSAVPSTPAAPAVPVLWEWALDFNSLPVSSGANDDATASSLFCGAGARARDARDYTTFLRYAFRSSLKANYTLKRLGLRCAKGATP
jgi:formylglycine-generating enzyme required for sulfatase activity